MAASAQTPDKLAGACLDDDPAGLAAASLALQELPVSEFANVARRYPRAVELAALIAARDGRLDDAARVYAAIVERLSGAHRTKERFVSALSGLREQRTLATTGVSRFATSGFALSGTIRTFASRDGGQLAAAAWVKTRCGYELSPDEAYLEVFRVTEVGQYTRLYDVEGSWLALESDFLVVNGPGRDPIIAVRDSRAGSCWACNRLRLLSIGSDAVTEITLPPEAPGVIVRIADLDGDGLAEALALDTRWEFWRGLCQVCSPSVVAIYRLEERRLVEACTEFPTFYAEQIQFLETHLPTEMAVDSAGAPVISIVLNLAQSGRLPEGRAYLHATLERARFASAADGEWAVTALAALDDGLWTAQPGRVRRCPVNAMVVAR